MLAGNKNGRLSCCVKKLLPFTVGFALVAENPGTNFLLSIMYMGVVRSIGRMGVRKYVAFSKSKDSRMVSEFCAGAVMVGLELGVPLKIRTALRASSDVPL